MTTADDERREGAGEALAGALEYAQAGYLVGPVTINLLPSGKKDPQFHTNWQYPRAGEVPLSSDEDQLKAWARRYPGCGFHAPCSPNGIVVPEGDVKRASEDGRVVSISGVKAWRSNGGPDTPMTVRTRSGGEHWYFAAPEVPIFNSTNAVEGIPNVDVRGEGGTVFIGGTHVYGPDGKSAGHYSAQRVVPASELPSLPVTWARRLREASKRTKSSDAGGGELRPGSRLWTPDRVHDRDWVVEQVQEACTRADELSRANFRHEFYAVAVTLYTAARADPTILSTAEANDVLRDAIDRVWHAPANEDDEQHMLDAWRKAVVNPWRVQIQRESPGAADDGDCDPFAGEGSGEGEERERTSWWFADLDDLFGDELAQEPPPVVLRRSDGACLLYAGRVNGVIGESESGKSWVAQHAASQALTDGGHVLYLDFEDSRTGVVGRLRQLGTEVEAIRARFAYIAPEEQLSLSPGSEQPAQQDWIEAVRHRTWTLIVVDGLNVALDLLGLGMEDNREAGRGMTRFLKPMARESGAAVFYVDHVPKDPTGRGKGPIGAQAKRALTDGTALRAAIDTPFGRGQSGKLKLTVDKDRHGHVRGISDEAQFVGMFKLNSTDAETGAVEAFIQGGSRPTAKEPTVVMESVSKFLQGSPETWYSTRAIRDNVRGNNTTISEALAALVLRGAVAREGGGETGKPVRHRFVRRFTRFIAGTEDADRAMAGLDLEPPEDDDPDEEAE